MYVIHISTVLDDSYRAWGSRVLFAIVSKSFACVTPRDEQEDDEEKRLFTSII